MALNQCEQDFFKSLAQQTANQPQSPLNELTIEELRHIGSVFKDYADQPSDIPYQDITITTADHHPLRARHYCLDDQTRPTLIFFPGCGYIHDMFDTNHVVVSKIAQAAQCHAILVQFRLAPEHPITTAVKDSLDAVTDITQNPAAFNATPNQFIIGGHSSGANIATVVCHELNTRQHGIAHQLLIEGMYDFSQPHDRFSTFEQQDYLCSKEMVDFLIDFLVPNPDDRTNTLISPYLRTNFSHLPPATLLVGQYSGVRSHSEAYADKLEQAGIPINKIVTPGQTHNTMTSRKVLHEGDDPALIAARALKDAIQQMK